MRAEANHDLGGTVSDRRAPRLSLQVPDVWVYNAVALAAVSYVLVSILDLAALRRFDEQTAGEVVASVLLAFAWSISRRHPVSAAVVALSTVMAELTHTVLVADLSSFSVLPTLVCISGLLLGRDAPLLFAALSTGAAFLARGPDGGRADAHLVLIEVVTVWVAALVTRAFLGSYARVLRRAQDARRGYEALYFGAAEGLLALEHGRITRANPSAARLLRTSFDALQGRTLHEALVAAGATDLHDLRAPVALRRSGEAPLWIEIGAREGDGGDGLVVLLDVTEREAGDEQRRAFEQRLSAANRLETVGQLTSGIAHDFGNLLAAIGANAELLEHHPDPLVREIIADVLLAQRSGLSLTRRLVSFSRREAVVLAPLDAAPVLRDLSRLLSRFTGARHQLRADVSESLPVHADRSQLEQVVLNLVTNARDALPQGGEIALRGACLDRHLARELGSSLDHDGQVLLEVRDGGDGMDEATRARLFEPFFTTKAPGHGTGLGLKTVHAIVTQSGGCIHVESSKGAGSSFRVFLPRISAAA